MDSLLLRPFSWINDGLLYCGVPIWLSLMLAVMGTAQPFAAIILLPLFNATPAVQTLRGYLRALGNFGLRSLCVAIAVGGGLTLLTAIARALNPG